MSEILVGVDGTPGADDALAFAKRLAGPTGATLHLVNAFPYSDVPSRASNEAFREILRADAQAVLDRAAAQLDGEVPTHTVADPSPAHALHELAEKLGASLVVVGSTHRGTIGRVMPGSTGERLLHGAPCPVAIVPHSYHEREAAGIQTIGVGYDGSEEAEAALNAACELARRLGATVRVIRVFDSTQVGTPALMSGPGYITVHKEIERMQREHLDRRVSELPASVEAEAVFVLGGTGRAVATQSEGVDLLVMGSRGYGPLRAVLLGGVTHAVVRKGACPVVVLPRGMHAGMSALFSAAGGLEPAVPSPGPREH